MKLLLSLLSIVVSFINLFLWYFSSKEDIANLIVAILGLIVTILFILGVSNKEFKGD